MTEDPITRLEQELLVDLNTITPPTVWTLCIIFEHQKTGERLARFYPAITTNKEHANELHARMIATAKTPVLQSMLQFIGDMNLWELPGDLTQWHGLYMRVVEMEMKS